MYIRAGTYADVISEEHETCADRALVWTASVRVVTATNEQYYRSAFDTEYEKSSSTTLTYSLLLNPQGAHKRADSPRARTPINPSAVLYEQAAARTSLPAKVGNISSTSSLLFPRHKSFHS
ncbi:hypothetical protein HBI46_242950 [Parastagonospora nodorum]|nr:hypothetical protein HBI46_242950 [Parastagonospora nodorum]